MDDIIEMIIVLILIEGLGVWYFLAGLYGWRYPQIRAEWTYKGQHNNLYVQFWKIVLGIILIVAGIGALMYRIWR